VRAVLIVLDGVGCGALPDAARYGDEGSDSLGNTARAVGGLRLPNLARTGLGNVTDIVGVPPTPAPTASFGKMAEKSTGKDTTSGHWELAGLIVERPFPTYPSGFPPEVLESFERAVGRQVLGNMRASGTEIIARLGEEHMRTGRPILYTSADSVFQVAAHEDLVPVDELYAWCRSARALLTGEHAVGRVIARPFTGAPGAFTRTPRRRDFSLPPTGETVLDRVAGAGMRVAGVGKIDDVFAGRGVTDCVHTVDNADGVARIAERLREPWDGLLFANLIETDSRWGHRNDPRGYAGALEALDTVLPELAAAAAGDLLIITADHGVDPTTGSTDHSREYVPLLVACPGREPRDLGTRETFADVAATVSVWLGLGPFGPGKPLFE